MFLKLKDIVGNIFHTDEKEKAEKQKNTTALQNKTSKVFGTTEKSNLNTYNPFIKQSGELVYPSLNYQRLIDNPQISQRTKDYITSATGLTPTKKETETSNESHSSYKKIIDLTNQKIQKSRDIEDIGFISAKYESGGNGGTVSSGNGDYGGVSYGVSQLSSKAGSADKFVEWLKTNNPQMASAFKNYKAGTTEFSNAWKQTFTNYGDNFTKMQKQYTYNSHVKPLADLAKQETGIDYTRSPALMELLYSTAIQFGAGSLGLSALGNVTSNMTDEEIVNASYDKKISNYKIYFSSSSTSVQESVKNRFTNERKDVLQLISK